MRPPWRTPPVTRKIITEMTSEMIKHWQQRQRGRGEYCDVDIQVGSGFLNYINGYVAQSSDCVDFSAKEYSEADGEGAENTDWKRTYRGLMKGTPARNAAARLQGSRLMNA